MPEYINNPITTDPDELQQDAFDYLLVKWPNWEPNESNFEAWLIAALARMVAEARDVASDVPDTIFRALGASLLGLPAVAATAATVPATFVLGDTDGHTIPEGLLVAIYDADEEPVAFEVTADVIVPNGSSTTAAGGVTLQAVNPGLDTTGLGGNGVTAEQIDVYQWISSITLTDQTLGGLDEEDQDDYMDRLSARLTLMTPRPILPKDFELLAKDIAVTNGYTIRVLAIDGYNPVAVTTGNEKTIALILIEDTTGVDVPAGLKTILVTELEALREVNFEVYTDDPDRTDVDVTYTAKCYSDADPVEVKATADGAVADYLSPANWGQPLNAQERKWVFQDKVRMGELYAVLNAVEGLDYVETLTIGLSGGAQTAADHTLTGNAPIAEPGVIVGTVTLP